MLTKPSTQIPAGRRAAAAVAEAGADEDVDGIAAII
jgi:hypothetical protein